MLEFEAPNLQTDDVLITDSSSCINPLTANQAIRQNYIDLGDFRENLHTNSNAK